METLKKEFTPPTSDSFSRNYKKFANPEYIKAITPPIAALFVLLKQESNIGWNNWLDVGCGAGVCFQHFPQTTKVVAIDYAPKLIQYAQRYVNDSHLNNVTCLQQDIHELNLEQNNFDGALLFQVYPHLKHQALSGIRQFLKLGGYIVISYGAVSQQIENTHHYHPELSSRPIPLKIHMVSDMTNAGFQFIQEINLDSQKVSQLTGIESKRPLVGYLGKKVIE